MPLLMRHPKILRCRSLPNVSRDMKPIPENQNLDAQKCSSVGIKQFLSLIVRDKM